MFVNMCFAWRLRCCSHSTKGGEGTKHGLHRGAIRVSELHIFVLAPLCKSEHP